MRSVLALRSWAVVSTVLGSILLVVACSSSRTSGSPRPTPAASPASAASGVQAQIDRGGPLYAANCSACHGAGGEGSAQAPALIGPGALPTYPPPGRRMRTGAFASAMDLGMFIKTSMPPGGPHLPPDQVAAVMAWILQGNGITPAQPISPSTAGAIRLAR